MVQPRHAEANHTEYCGEEDPIHAKALYQNEIQPEVEQPLQKRAVSVLHPDSTDVFKHVARRHESQAAKIEAYAYNQAIVKQQIGSKPEGNKRLVEVKEAAAAKCADAEFQKRIVDKGAIGRINAFSGNRIADPSVPGGVN